MCTVTLSGAVLTAFSRGADSAGGKVLGHGDRSYEAQQRSDNPEAFPHDEYSP
jgi:hypothetical protein